MKTSTENGPELWRACLPVVGIEQHKYDRGHALVVGGYPMTGAARLAACAAARVGAGLTTVAVPDIAFPIYATALTSIIVEPLTVNRTLEDLLAERSFSACLIGCGAGVGAATRESVKALLAGNYPIVLDADALTSFSGDPATLFARSKRECVMTPHEGEFARLFDSAGTRTERAIAAAMLSGSVVVLKGHETVIAAPDGQSIVNTNAPPTLATAGSGDVLGGIILGLLARGMPNFESAAAGVWLHGEAAALFGPGLIADDLPDLIPQVLKRLI